MSKFYRHCLFVLSLSIALETHALESTHLFLQGRVAKFFKVSSLGTAMEDHNATIEFILSSNSFLMKNNFKVELENPNGLNIRKVESELNGNTRMKEYKFIIQEEENFFKKNQSSNFIIKISAN